MGLILDSSVVIAAGRRGDSVEKLIEQVISATGDQDVALSSVGLTELAHGIYRAQDLSMKLRRQAFVDDLLHDMAVYPYTRATAMLAAKIDGEQRARGVTIPFADLLIGASAPELGYSVATVNLRHFRLIPGLAIIPL